MKGLQLRSGGACLSALSAKTMLIVLMRSLVTKNRGKKTWRRFRIRKSKRYVLCPGHDKRCVYLLLLEANIN
jgi:hypothetical protein